MKDLKGTRTEECLKAAYAGESQAHTKYLFYASRAKKDGYVQMANIFEETARNEKEHGKMWFKYLQGTQALLKLHAKKALRKLQRSLKWWLKLKKHMRSAIVNC